MQEREKGRDEVGEEEKGHITLSGGMISSDLHACCCMQNIYVIDKCALINYICIL